MYIVGTDLNPQYRAEISSPKYMYLEYMYVYKVRAMIENNILGTASGWSQLIFI